MKRIALLGAAVLAVTTWAMSIGRSMSVIAWAADGTSALVSVSEHGPEGGGSRSYRVVCGGELLDVKVSSNFSPGGSSRPQRVSEQACRDALAELSKALAARGFKGVTVTPDDCKTRSAMVSTSEEPASELPKGWKQATRGDKTVLMEGERVVFEVPGGGTARVSPSGKAVIVFSKNPEATDLLGGWVRSASGEFAPCR